MIFINTPFFTLCLLRNCTSSTMAGFVTSQIWTYFHPTVASRFDTVMPMFDDDVSPQKFGAKTPARKRERALAKVCTATNSRHTLILNPTACCGYIIDCVSHQFSIGFVGLMRFFALLLNFCGCAQAQFCWPSYGENRSVYLILILRIPQ